MDTAVHHHHYSIIWFRSGQSINTLMSLRCFFLVFHKSNMTRCDRFLSSIMHGPFLWQVCVNVSCSLMTKLMAAFDSAFGSSRWCFWENNGRATCYNMGKFTAGKWLQTWWMWPQIRPLLSTGSDPGDIQSTARGQTTSRTSYWNHVLRIVQWQAWLLPRI